MGVSKRVRACPRFSSRVICGLFIQPLFLSQAFFLSSAHATPQCSTTDNESQCVGTITSTCTDTAPVSAGGASGFGCPDTAEFAAALAAALAPPQSAADKALARAMIDYMHAVDAQANALEASLAQPCQTELGGYDCEPPADPAANCSKLIPVQGGGVPSSSSSCSSGANGPEITATSTCSFSCQVGTIVLPPPNPGGGGGL